MAALRGHTEVAELLESMASKDAPGPRVVERGEEAVGYDEIDTEQALEAAAEALAAEADEINGQVGLEAELIEGRRGDLPPCGKAASSHGLGPDILPVSLSHAVKYAQAAPPDAPAVVGSKEDAKESKDVKRSRTPPPDIIKLEPVIPKWRQPVRTVPRSRLIRPPIVFDLTMLEGGGGSAGGHIA